MEKPQVVVHPSLITQPGKESSSYTVALVAALAPVLMFFAVIIGLIFIHEPEVRGALIQMLVYVILPGIMAGGAVGWKYVGSRGELSVAKTKGLSEVLTAQLGSAPASEGASLTVTQENK